MADTRAQAAMREAIVKELEDSISQKLAAIVDSKMELLAKERQEELDRISVERQKEIDEMFETFRLLQGDRGTTSQTSNNQVHHNLDHAHRGGYSGITRLSRLDFPKFGGDKVKEWLFRCEQFFLLDRTPDDLKIQLVSVHLEDRAANWHQSVVLGDKGFQGSWKDYRSLILERFGPVLDDPIAELKNLQETDGIESYHEQFELIRTRVTLPEDDLVRAYLAGLCPDTQMNVRMFQPHTVRQCLMIGKMYEFAHPCQPRKSEKRSVPQDTEFRAPDVCSPINPQELMDSRSIGSTIISDISIAEDEGCQENSQNRFVHGIPSNPSEFVFQGDLDKPEMGNTLVLLKLKGGQELLNTMMDDCKDKSIQFFPAHHAPQLFDEMSKRDFEDFRPSKVKCAIVSAGVGMNFMQLIAVLDGYNDLRTPHGKWLRIADAESIKTVAISSARQVFDNMPIRETQAVNKGSCLIVHALIVYVPVDGCIVISFNKLLVFDPGGIQMLFELTSEKRLHHCLLSCSAPVYISPLRILVVQRTIWFIAWLLLVEKETYGTCFLALMFTRRNLEMS